MKGDQKFIKEILSSYFKPKQTSFHLISVITQFAFQLNYRLRIQACIYDPKADDQNEWGTNIFCR